MSNFSWKFRRPAVSRLSKYRTIPDYIFILLSNFFKLAFRKKKEKKKEREGKERKRKKKKSSRSYIVNAVGRPVYELGIVEKSFEASKREERKRKRERRTEKNQ